MGTKRRSKEEEMPLTRRRQRKLWGGVVGARGAPHQPQLAGGGA